MFILSPYIQVPYDEKINTVMCSFESSRYEILRDSEGFLSKFGYSEAVGDLHDASGVN